MRTARAGDDEILNTDLLALGIRVVKPRYALSSCHHRNHDRFRREFRVDAHGD